MVAGDPGLDGQGFKGGLAGGCRVIGFGGRLAGLSLCGGGGFEG